MRCAKSEHWVAESRRGITINQPIKHMAITPICDKCKKELTDFGGILLSPPDVHALVRKFHLCEECYNAIIKEF